MRRLETFKKCSRSLSGLKVFCLLGVKGTASSSNNTIEVERVLGIEAAR